MMRENQDARGPRPSSVDAGLPVVALPSHVVQALQELVGPPKDEEPRDSLIRDSLVKAWLDVKVATVPAEKMLGKREHFGVCPICGGCDSGFNINRSNWLVCETHKLIWCIGENLLSSWRHETDEDWEFNRRRYEPYDEVNSW